MFIKSFDNLSNYPISINTLNKHVSDCLINKNIKLMLIFSIKKCNPCEQLSSILDELFNNAKEQSISIPLQVIKFDYSNLHLTDTDYFETFPTTLVINPQQLQSIDDNDSLISFAFNNCKIYKGQLQKLCDDHNLISF